jgi:Right handed beta helix region
MTRIIAKLFAVTVVFTAFLPVAPLFAAAALTFVASNGSDSNPCTAAQPCATFNQAFSIVSGGQITCLNPTGFPLSQTSFGLASFSLTIDCPGTIVPGTGFGLEFLAASQVIKIRNLTFDGTLTDGGPAILVTGSGTMILENCIFENLTGNAIVIEPTGALTLVIKNSRVSNNTGGVLIKPASGGSVTATFDGVTIVNNTGGLRTDSTNGAVRVDVSNSTISNNTANGMVAIGGAGQQNIMNLGHDVIASNGQFGIEASGATAVFIDTTLLDENASGAISSVAGGGVFTYGTNRIIGSPGSGFSSTTPLR